MPEMYISKNTIEDNIKSKILTDTYLSENKVVDKNLAFIDANNGSNAELITTNTFFSGLFTIN